MSIMVGSEVIFRENDEYQQVLGTVSRVWSNGRYVTILSDGRTFVRDLRHVVLAAPIVECCISGVCDYHMALNG